MATQTATTGQLENAQGIMIAAARYTAEHSAPCVNLIEHMTLKKEIGRASCRERV